MAWTAPPTWVPGQVVAASDLQSSITDNENAIAVTTTYTPTVGGTGWAKGNGALTGYYTKPGNRCQVTIVFTLGTTSTGGTGGLTFSAPVAVATGRGVGTGELSKGSVLYASECDVVASTITPYCLVAGTAGQFGFVVNGAPSAGVWTTADFVIASLDYFT